MLVWGDCGMFEINKLNRIGPILDAWGTLARIGLVRLISVVI
jgi:hypothetical protein